MVGVAAIWGSTFILVQDAVEATPPFRFLALRFALATIVMIAAGGLRGIARADVTAGSVIGLALFAGYALQTVGLQYTSAANAGLLTGLFVVFTPLLGALAYRVLPSKAAVAGVILALAGLILLTMPAGLGIGRGDSLEIATGASFAVHILLIARFGSGRSARGVATIQLAVTAVLSASWSFAAEGAPVMPTGTVWFAAAFTAVFASALAFFVQTRAQQSLPPVRTAVILAAEPAFAALAGVLIAGDVLGVRGWTGATLILAGIWVAAGLAPAEERL